MAETTAAIVVIGNEILTGKSQDQNASFLTRELYELGIALGRIVVIPDDPDEIGRTVRDCAGRFQLVFTSGGIGPTHDDVTIEGVARAFGRRVVRHPELEAMIRGYFGDGVDEVRLRMADVPEGAVLIRPAESRWPILAVENTYILPGVPELFRSKFVAMRERFRVKPFHTRVVYTLQDEFDIAEGLNRLAADHQAVIIGSYPNFARDDYKVKVTLESKEADATEKALVALLAMLEPGALVKTE
jgi:molybdenum cofactor synthesis domain-containing protein